MFTDTETLYNQRLKRITTTLNHEEPDHVPIMSALETWAVRYAGKTSLDVLGTPEEFKCFEKVYNDIYSDAMLMSFLTRDIRMYETLGNSPYFYSSDNITVQHNECCYMAEDEYPEFIADPFTYTVNNYFKRKYPIFQRPYPESYEGLKKSLEIFLSFIQKAEMSSDYYRKSIGMVSMISQIAIMPFDMILDSYRGLKGTLLDVRRHPELLVEACEALVPWVIGNVTRGQSKLDPFPLIFFPNDGASYLSPKQFEKIYYPTFKKILDKLYEMGAKVLMANPGDWSALYDFLNELPPNFAACMVDKDDIFEAKKRVGKNVTIVGGIPPHILRSPDITAAKEYCKKLIDACAPGGGFIAAEATMLLAPNDAVVDTLKEVHSFIHEYGKY